MNIKDIELQAARECGACGWCRSGDQKCAWRTGLFDVDLFPLKSKIVLHNLRIAGHNSFLVQPLRGRIPYTAKPFLAEVATYYPVVTTTAPVRKGGIVDHILAADAVAGQEVAKELGFGERPAPIEQEVVVE